MILDGSVGIRVRRFLFALLDLGRKAGRSTADVEKNDRCELMLRTTWEVRRSR